MMSDRYDADSSVEGQYQPGSDGTVLFNKFGITRPEEINEIELDLLIQLTDSVLEDVTDEQIITAEDLCEWHRRWLGHLYEWAGWYRSVNMGKAELHFASV